MDLGKQTGEEADDANPVGSPAPEARSKWRDEEEKSAGDLDGSEYHQAVVHSGKVATPNDQSSANAERGAGAARVARREDIRATKEARTDEKRTSQKSQLP